MPFTSVACYENTLGSLDLDEQILLEAYDTDNTVVYDEIELAETKNFEVENIKIVPFHFLFFIS